MELSASDLLAATNRAIYELTVGGAASYSIGSRSVTKNDLDKLYKSRDKLLFEVAREQRGGSMFTVATLRRPR